jgi:phospholipid/cholesterol/gamma-HCH transport system substrate-binding protein
VEIIAAELAEVMSNINSGKGMLGQLIVDSAIAGNVGQIIANIQTSSEGIDETIELTKENVYTFMEKLQLTVAKTEIASNALGEIMVQVNSGEGTLGMLIQDTTVAHNISQTMYNVAETSQSMDEFVEALKSNFFFRRYFRKLEEEKLEKEEEAERLELERENATKGEFITVPGEN